MKKTNTPKQQTPMHLLSSHFDKIKDLTSNTFRFVFLNKAKEKTHWSGYMQHTTKGVKSDAVLIFDSNGGESFAFTFTYIDLEKEDYRIRFSKKKDPKLDFIESSLDLSMDDFKILIKNSIDTLESVTHIKTTKFIIDAFSNQFLSPALMSLKSTLDTTLVGKIQDKRDELDIDGIKKRIDMTEVLYKQNFVARDKELRNTPTYRKIQMLTRELKVMQDKLVREDLELTEKFQLNQLQKTINDDYKLLADAQKEMNSFIKKEKGNILLFKPKNKTI